VTLVVDEAAAHGLAVYDERVPHVVHVKVQRVGALGRVDTERLSPKAGVLILATTHSPFVPLSVETRVDEAHHALWDPDLLGNAVTLARLRWQRRPERASRRGGLGLPEERRR